MASRWWNELGSGLCSGKKLLEEKVGSFEVDPLARASSLGGSSLPRGFLSNVEVQQPSALPGALAGIIAPPSTSPSVLIVSSNLERSRPLRSPFVLEVLGPSISPSILAGAVVVPSVPSYTLAVRKPLVPLALSRAFLVGPSLPRGFPGELAAVDGAAFVF